MSFEFDRKTAPGKTVSPPVQAKTPAELKAERLRVAREAAEIARQRRARIAMVQAGRLSPHELDESERILLESYERKEEMEQRPGFFEKLARRIAGSALGTLVAQGHLKPDHTVVIVSSILVGDQIVDAVQMRVVS